MLTLKESNVTPPDKFRFQCPLDGCLITAYDKQDWFNKIEKHYVDNGYELPQNFREIAEDQLCRTLSGEWCDGGKPSAYINTTRFTINDFIRGTQVLGSFALSRDEVVSQSVADQRALICSRCYANVTVPGCKTCNQMANVVAEAKGARKTPYDYLLKACGVCHCSNEAQVWIPAEHLAKGVTSEMMEKYEEVPDCWKAKEIDALSIGV
jgi:hypothetical protein